MWERARWRRNTTVDIMGWWASPTKKLRDQLTVVNYVLSITFARPSRVCLRAHGCAYKLYENICQFLAPSARLNALAFHVWGLHTTPAQKGLLLLLCGHLLCCYLLRCYLLCCYLVPSSVAKFSISRFGGFEPESYYTPESSYLGDPTPS